MTELVAWILAFLFAGVAVSLWLRRGPDAERTGGDVNALLTEVRKGLVSPSGPPNEAPELRELRRELSRRLPGDESSGGGGGDQALARIARYLEGAVVRPLERAGDRTDALREAAQGALDALADLEFFTRDGQEEVRADNLTETIQAVTREFALEYEVGVKLRGEERPVRARFASESLKDAVYLLLVNGARFGGEQPVEVVVEDGGDGPRVRVLDRGPGFSPEALEKGTEPFFTTEKDALGLGLTHVRQVVDAVGGRLRMRNREGGGAEVELLLPPPS